jgi:hypothetical protein
MSRLVRVGQILWGYVVSAVILRQNILRAIEL